MAYFKYSLEIDRVQDRYAIVAESDGTGPDCTKQMGKVVVGFALGANDPDPGILMVKTLPLSAMHKVVDAVQKRVEAL